MKYEAILSSNDPDWKTEARARMTKKEHFIVDNWEFSFDNQDSTELAQEFDYTVKLDPGTQRALFAPRKSQKTVNYELL
jgi:hypothetical protein